MFVSNATMLLKLKAWVIVIINKEDKSCFIVDIAIPGDAQWKKGWKVAKYQDLKRETMRMCNLKSAQVITRKLGDWLGKLGITLRTAFPPNKSTIRNSKDSEKGAWYII